VVLKSLRQKKYKYSMRITSERLLMMMKKIFIKWLFICASVLVTSVVQAKLPEFVDLVKDASPAVVNITVTKSATPNQYQQFGDQQVPEFFRRYFGEQPRGSAPPRQNRAQPATGSGFIISEDGYILTNNHVVENADEIIVALSDRRQREATLVGADKFSDLALLKIDATDLPTVEFGDSDELEVGEWVVAIGSPFGFEHSVTAGIVSAKGRSLPGDNGANYVPFIQTDVAINPGNSGGPLFNLKGEVVGINSQIFTRSGGFMGLSFSIPVNVALNVVRQIREKGTVSRGWLGVQIQRVDRDLAESFKLDRAAGALITQVFEGSPAEKGGLKEGDIILKFAGKAIDLSSELPHIVGMTEVDAMADVVIVRDGKRQTFGIKIGALEQDSTMLGAPGVPKQLGNRIGVEVESLNESMMERLGTNKGLVILRVFEGAGQQAGLVAGDVITTWDSVWINSIEQFESTVAKMLPNVAIPIRVVRGGSPQFMVIKITE
jgi:serine protease Do